MTLQRCRCKYRQPFTINFIHPHPILMARLFDLQRFILPTYRFDLQQ